MKISKNEGLAMAAAAAFGIMGWLLYKSEKRLHDKEQKFNVDLESLKDNVTEEIRKGIHDDAIKAAINKGVDRKLDTVLKEAKVEAIDAARKDINSSVSGTVKTTWDLMKNNVERDLLEKVGEIDTTEIKREAVEKARDKAVMEASTAIDKVVDDIRTKFDRRADDAIKSAESRFNKSVDRTLNALKDRYQGTMWAEFWR